MVPFERLGVVFYSSSVATTAVFSRFWDIHRHIMEWPWNRVWGRFMSLKMAPFDRSYTTFSILHHFRVI